MCSRTLAIFLLSIEAEFYSFNAARPGL